MVIFLFMSTIFAYFSALPLDKIILSGELLVAEYFTVVFGKVAGEKVLPIFIGISSYGAVCAMVFSASRVIFSSAKSNLLPFSSYDD